VLSAQALTIAIERLHAAVEAGGPLGFQFYTSQDADPVCNVAVGHYRLGEEITTGHRLPWICSGKPVTVIALAQMYERGRLSTATRVAEVVPEFGRHGKQDVTIEHLLTHTVLFDGDELWDTPDRATALATIATGLCWHRRVNAPATAASPVGWYSPKWCNAFPVSTSTTTSDTRYWIRWRCTALRSGTSRVTGRRVM
jgi:hypothetical protein